MHWAIHLAKGFYISKIGKYGTVRVMTLAALSKFFACAYDGFAQTVTPQ